MQFGSRHTHIDSYCCLVSGIFSGKAWETIWLVPAALEQETAEKPRMDEQEFQKILLLESCVCVKMGYVPLFWVNFITPHYDRALESWLVREIIPKWP